MYIHHTDRPETKPGTNGYQVQLDHLEKFEKSERKLEVLN